MVLHEYRLRVECDCCEGTPLDETRRLPGIRSAWDIVIACSEKHSLVSLAEAIGPEVAE